YSPGTILIFAAIIAVVLQRKSFSNFMSAAKESVLSIKDAALALFATLALVQVFTNSGINGADLIGMPQYIAHSLANSLGPVWLFVAPFLGELGSFITGSATVSTLTFSPVQYDIAQATGMSVPMILALQIIGAGTGNMICMHRVVAVLIVVGISGKEGTIIRKTILPAILYVLMTGIGAYILLLFM